MPHADPAKRKQKQDEYRQRNRAELAAKQREYYQRTRPDRMAATEVYMDANPQVRRAIRFANGSNRRARRWSTTPEKVWAAELLRDMPLATCTYCGGEPYTWDHVVPMHRGGRNHISNLTPACQPCNREKNHRLLEEWRPSDLPDVITTLRRTP